MDDQFFEKFENSEVKKGSLKADVVLTKQTTLMIFEFAVKGTVELLCDRCLDNYQQKVKNKSKLFVKFGHEEEELSDDVIVIDYEEFQLNVARFLYELVILGLPVKRTHPVDKNGKSGCDPEMIKKLNEYLITEETVSDEEPVDDSWKEELKKLLDNN